MAARPFYVQAVQRPGGRSAPPVRRDQPGEFVPAPRSSRSSQAFAIFQSRMTVSGDTCSAAAVSCTLKPPKNRISITRLFRSSTFASASSASSSATRSRSGSGEEREVRSEADVHGAAPALHVLLRAREIDEDASHQASRHRQKVRAVLPVHALGLDQPQVGFVDERGRLERMVAFLSGHAAARNPVELVVDDRNESRQRRFVAVAPGDEQCRDVMRRRFGRASGGHDGMWLP